MAETQQQQIDDLKEEIERLKKKQESLQVDLDLARPVLTTDHVPRVVWKGGG